MLIMALSVQSKNKWMSQEIHKSCKNKHSKATQRHFNCPLDFYHDEYLSSKCQQRRKKITRRRLKKKLQRKVSSDLDDFMLGNQTSQKVNITSAYNHIYNSQNIVPPPQANLIPTSSKQEFTTQKPIKVKAQFWLKDAPIHGTIAYRESDKKHIGYKFFDKFRQGQLQEIQMEFWNQYELLNSTRIIPGIWWNRNITKSSDYKSFDKVFEPSADCWVKDCKLQKLANECYNIIKPSSWPSTGYDCSGTPELSWKDSVSLVKHDGRDIIRNVTCYLFDGISGLILIIRRFIGKSCIVYFEMNGELDLGYRHRYNHYKYSNSVLQLEWLQSLKKRGIVHLKWKTPNYMRLSDVGRALLECTAYPLNVYKRLSFRKWRLGKVKWTCHRDRRYRYHVHDQFCRRWKPCDMK